MNTTPKQDAGDSIALQPTDALITWLEGQKAHLLRVPIVLVRSDGFEISKARLGALVVYANDAALGIGLRDRASQACKDGEPACGFWVDAHWRGKRDDRFQLDVMEIQSRIDDLRAADHVSIKGSAP